MDEQRYHAIEQEIAELERKVEDLKAQLDEEDNQYRWALVRGVPDSPMPMREDRDTLVDMALMAKNIGDVPIGEAVRSYRELHTKGFMNVQFFKSKPRGY